MVKRQISNLAARNSNNVYYLLTCGLYLNTTLSFDGIQRTLSVHRSTSNTLDESTETWKRFNLGWS